MMKLYTINTGSRGNSYILEQNNDRLLLDAGVPIKSIEVAVGHMLTAFSGVLCSHVHQDHCKAIPDLLNRFIPCYMTKPTAEALSLPMNHPKLFLVEHGKVWRAGNWYGSCFDLEHDALGTVGFLIEHTKSKQVIAYITDTAYVRYRLPAVSTLVAECNFVDSILLDNEEELSDNYIRIKHTHMSMKRLTNLLDAMDRSLLQNIVLVHLSDRNSDEARMVEHFQNRYGVNVYAADRGLTVNLDLPF